MRREFAHAVIGLGGIGSAAAYRLALRTGGDVLGLEQFDLGHDRGASHDHSRIIRRSYHTPGYVRLAAAAYDAWAEIEAEASETLVHRTGGLDLWPVPATIPMEDYTRSLQACAVEFEELDAGEVMRRWPSWRLEDGVRALFQEDGGFVAAERATSAHQGLARERGATLLGRTPVVAVRPAGGEVEVATEGGDLYRCGGVVIAADAWTNDLLAGLGVRLPLTVTQEQVTYFRARDSEAFSPELFPVWIWMDDPSFYGLPSFGEAGPKVAQDVGGREVTPDSRTFRPDQQALGRVREFLARRLPEALGPEIATRTCLYTLTPDRDFVLDAVPGHPEIQVALGAAHGFKFAALFGKILTELALDGTTAHDVTAFRMDRPGLTSVGAPRKFLV
jgi:monomeric sarcosine oxidase